MKFKLGDTVRKIKGSEWKGTVVGTYSTALTPEGYAVESSTEKGSVQIYPASALELWEVAPSQEPDYGGGCTLAGPGRGDCEHFIGLPGASTPGQHDGDDDTVDCYGKPNGWCWSCWKSKQLSDAAAQIAELKEQIAKLEADLDDAKGVANSAWEQVRLANKKLAAAEKDAANLRKAIERMRVAGGSQEFQMAFELAKDLL